MVIFGGDVEGTKVRAVMVTISREMAVMVTTREEEGRQEGGENERRKLHVVPTILTHKKSPYLKMLHAPRIVPNSAIKPMKFSVRAEGMDVVTEMKPVKKIRMTMTLKMMRTLMEMMSILKVKLLL